MEKQIPDSAMRAQIAEKIKKMAEENIYEISLDVPFEKMKLYHEDSHELTDTIKKGAISFTVPGHKFFIF